VRFSRYMKMSKGSSVSLPQRPPRATRLHLETMGSNPPRDENSHYITCTYIHGNGYPISYYIYVCYFAGRLRFPKTYIPNITYIMQQSSRRICDSPLVAGVFRAAKSSCVWRRKKPVCHSSDHDKRHVLIAFRLLF